MHLSTGVDMAELRRVRKLLRNPRFLERFFGPLEQKQFLERNSSANYIAGNFCAKEAFSKALGTGMRGFALRDVQVLRDDLGAPYFNLSGAVASYMEGVKFSLSITHTKEYATAVTVIWREDTPLQDNPGDTVL